MEPTPLKRRTPSPLIRTATPTSRGQRAPALIPFQLRREHFKKFTSLIRRFLHLCPESTPIQVAPPRWCIQPCWVDVAWEVMPSRLTQPAMLTLLEAPTISFFRLRPLHFRAAGRAQLPTATCL